uniref:Uncharacterized protein n=1 Tax=Tanacetum cinerariifolium TaxID=118510 RepID=A0A699HB49_TANCI|nr:hypothetical protein [Tanacetum cinerariifolium]
MAKSSSSLENEACCSKFCMKNTDSLNTKIIKLSEKLSDCKTNLYHYKLGLSQVEARLIKFKNQEIKLCEKIRGLEFNVESKNNRIERLTNELEQIKKEKEGLDSKLTGFESAAKDINTLLESQRFDKNKEGLGYSDVPPFCSSLLTLSPSIESNTSDLQSNNSSVSELGESSGSIISKPMIKFVKAVIVPKSLKPLKVKLLGNHLENWPKNNFVHKNVTPRADLFKTASVSAARLINNAAPRPNVNSARPKTTQDLVIIKLIQRVKRLERELKARTPPTKIQYVDERGRSRYVMA